MSIMAYQKVPTTNHAIHGKKEKQNRGNKQSHQMDE